MTFSLFDHISPKWGQMSMEVLVHPKHFAKHIRSLAVFSQILWTFIPIGWKNCDPAKVAGCGYASKMPHI